MENRTGKYLKYALGEIILVVVGILIALQINNWNEDRKERLTEINYLKNLKRDLQKDAISLEQFIGIRKGKARAANQLLIYADKGFTEDIHAIDSMFTEVGIWYEYIPNDNTFNELVSSGQINLISNDSIKDLLMDLSKMNEGLVTDRNHMKREYDSYFYDRWFSAISFLDVRAQGQIKNVEDWFVPEKQVVDANKEKILRGIQSLFKDTAFINGLVLAGGNNEYFVANYQLMLSMVNDIIRLINRELAAGPKD